MRVSDEPTEQVWLTTSEAGVLNVWHYDPVRGWGYRGPRRIPASVLQRYAAAEKEFWEATKALSALFPEPDDN